MNRGFEGLEMRRKNKIQRIRLKKKLRVGQGGREREIGLSLRERAAWIQ